MLVPNVQQLRVITADVASNLKILACAGSGKTTTLICRIKYLIEHGAEPSKIWMTAFNVDAANQIKQKLKILLGARGEKVHVNNIDKIAKMIVM